MTGRPRTEAEQLAFFDDTYERFVKARESAGRVDHYYRVAGRTARLSFAGDRLPPYLTPALEHLRVPPIDSSDLTICLWDTHSTRVRMPPPPCGRESFTDRGDLWGFDSQRIKTAFHYHDFSVNLLDHERGIGVYWVNTAETLPYWVSASPLRTLFHWWMERTGCQLLHAAAVGTEDGAVLITGRGGIGKSTTALACLAGGLSYLADDYLIVRHDPEPTVYSLYSTAKLDPRRLDSFPALRPFVRNRPEDEKAVLFLYPHFLAQISPEMPIRAVAIPEITPGQADTRFRPEATAVVQQAASFTTMAQLPHVGRHTHEFFGRLCSALPGYALTLGHDLVRIPPAIRNFLRARAASVRGAARAATGETSAVSSPLVSVVIPVYNGERFLRDAVEAVLAQRYRSLEIIIVDDGSTDGTESVVKQLPCDVLYFKQDNTGPAAARNRGIRDSAGDLIAFLDVDDLWPENTLVMLVDEMARQPKLDVVHGYAQLLEYDPVAGTYEYRGSSKESFAWSIATALYRKRVFSTVGLFDPTLLFGEDTDWFNRAKELQVPMKRVEAVTLLVRRHGGNMTHDKSVVALNALRVLKKAIDRKRFAGKDRAHHAKPARGKPYA